jgi:hypothetical protein
MIPYLAWKNICRSDLLVYTVPNVGSLSEHVDGNFDGVLSGIVTSLALFCIVRVHPSFFATFLSWNPVCEAS